MLPDNNKRPFYAASEQHPVLSVKLCELNKEPDQIKYWLINYEFGYRLLIWSQIQWCLIQWLNTDLVIDHEIKYA